MSDDLKARFEQASAESTQLSKRPDNNIMLQLYGLYKQGAVGDVQDTRPGFTDLVGRAKYDAWAAHKGTPQDAAQQKYIDLVEELKAKDQG